MPRGKKAATEAETPLKNGSADHGAANGKPAVKGYVGIDLSTGEFEFGGTIGALALMIWSHYIVFYFW
jgi:hypothetical protein